MTIRRHVRAGLALVAMLAGPAGASDPSDPAGLPAPLTVQSLREATFRGLGVPARQVTLSGGRWQGPPAVPGGASVPSVRLVEEAIAHGDLDGDGVPEAAVLLLAEGGGSGSFVHLAVVKAVAGRARPVAAQLVGDRIQVRDLRIDGGRVRLDAVRAGPGDAACCPGELATLGWRLQRGRLVPDPVSVTGRLGPAAAAGPTWVLERWAGGEPVAADGAPTLAIEDARLTGSAGCNRYQATIATGAGPGDLVPGPVATTRRACEGEAAAVEARYLAQLPRASGLRFQFGRLVLNTPDGPLVYRRQADGGGPR